MELGKFCAKRKEKGMKGRERNANVTNKEEEEYDPDSYGVENGFRKINGALTTQEMVQIS